MRLNAISVLLLCFAVSTANAANEPQQEYEKPGFKSGHAYDGIIPEETVDLFTGALTIAQRDVPVPNYKPFVGFYELITRYYSSKIFRQAIGGGVCNPMASTIEDEFVGLGWSLHFGRLWDWNTTRPVLELPDGTRHIFYPDSANPTRMISKSLWILKIWHDDLSGADVYEATSSNNPDIIRIRFYQRLDNKYEDIRGSRAVIHAAEWRVYSTTDTSPLGGMTTVINYALDQSGLLWPTDIGQPCESHTRPITFVWDTQSVKPTLQKIQFPWIAGATLEFKYAYITGANGHTLLRTFSIPHPTNPNPLLKGKTYQYSYNPNNELTRILVSTDSNIDPANDLTIDYVYNSHDFRINHFFLNSACTRVVEQKKVNKTGGGFDTWTYSYPPEQDLVHKVTIIDPIQNKREVTFQGYSGIQPYVWFVGTKLQDETLQYMGGSSYTSLRKITSTYNFAEISTEKDSEASLHDSVKIPVLATETVTYPQTGQQATTTFLNYDRFGNVGEIQEGNFNNVVFRKTEFQYEHSNTDGDDSVFEDYNFIRNATHKTVRNVGGQIVSEVINDYYNSTGDDNTFGLLSKIRTWDSESNGFIDKNFYLDFRAVRRIGEQDTNGERNTYFRPGCSNIIDLVTDDLVNLAGPIFEGQIWEGEELGDWNWVFKNTKSPNGHITSYTYDRDQRLNSITPPAGDVININYNDGARTVTVTQGIASTAETYDAKGRLSQRQVSIDSSKTSTQTFGYDALHNLISESEKSLSSPSGFITRTYDALNRLLSVTNSDSSPNAAVTYQYTGPDVTIFQKSELGVDLITTMKYDSAGRLISVTEPDNTNTKTTYLYDVLDNLIMVCHNDNDDVCGLNSPLRRSFTYSTRGKLTSETHPESGTTTYAYDLLGRVKEKKFAGMSTSVKYAYDLRDRITNIDYPTDTDISFKYDGAPVPSDQETYVNPKSHLTGMVDAAGTTQWTQFSVHESAEKKKVILDLGFPQIIQYHYDSRANLDSITYPSGNTVSIPRNNANAISQIKRQFGAGSTYFLLDQIDYNAALLPSLFDFANGVNYTITSDVRNRPDVMSSPGQLSLDYAYNIRSLIGPQINTSQNGSPNQARTITYDKLGRIASFTHFGNPTLNYNFDIYGNLLSKTGALIEGPYAYTNNRINGVSYTQPGSQLTANGKTLAYNEENQLKSVTGSETTTYTYDGKGNRAKASSPSGGNRRFIYDESGNLLVEIKKESTQSLIEKEYINGPSGTLVTANYEDQRAQFTENFDDGIADFTVSLGTWTVVSQMYTAQATGTNWAISNACITCTNCVIKANAQSVNQAGNKNAFIIFDFVSNTNFKYAGFDVSAGKWVIGDVISGTRTDRAFSTTSPPLAGTFYSLEVKFIGSVVYLKVGGITRVVYSFTSINPSRFALGVQGGQSRFDNVSTTPPYAKALFHSENFNDGVADAYTVVSGTWSVVSLKYQGSSNNAIQPISRPPVSVFNGGTIELDCQPINNGSCWILFDYTNSTNYKFAGVNTALNRWELGYVTNGTITYLSTVIGASGNINYHFKLLLEASKNATLIYNNAIKVQGTYAANFSTGQIALYVSALTTCKFDNVEVYDDVTSQYAPDYSAGPFYYHLNDHLGSTRILTDKNGAVVASLEFYPFGEAKQSSGCSNFIDQRFTGKLLDSESGLQYFGARYLSNNLTRFTSVDPARESFAQENPQSWNRYPYSLNDPANLRDRDGNIAVAAVWAAVEFGLTVYDAYTTVKTLSDPKASTLEKGVTTAGFVIGLVAPGGGYSKLGKEGVEFVTIYGDDALKQGSKLASRSPDFVVTPKGEAIPVPKNASGPHPPQKGSGMVYEGGSGGHGMNERVSGVRIMDADKNHPKRVSYTNERGQKVDPSTGRTVSNKDPKAHIPLKE